MKALRKWWERQSSVWRGEDFPIDRIIGKSFAAPRQLAHYRLLEAYERDGRDGFDWRQSDYVRRARANASDVARSFDALPDGLEVQPSWWVMPWAAYPLKKGTADPELVERKALEKMAEFFDLYESIKAQGYLAPRGGAIKGYILQHPSWGAVFNQIDGHHRMAILTFLRDRGQLSENSVRVLPLQTIERDRLSLEPSFRNGIRDGAFTERDAFRLFDHLFHQLGSGKEERADD